MKPNSFIRVLVIGSPMHCKTIGIMLSAAKAIFIYEYQIYPLSYIFLVKIIRAKIIHIVYCPESLRFLVMIVFLKLFRKKTVIHWVGTDVLSVLRPSIKSSPQKVAAKLASANLASAPWLVQELFSVGIIAKFLPIVPNMRSIVPSQRRSRSVIFYLPEGKSDLHNSNILLSLADNFSDVMFIVVGSRPGLSRKNIIEIGWTDNMIRFYDSCLALIRVPKHDGLSLMVLESLLHKLYVIYSNPIPFCFTVHSENEIKEALKRILEMTTLNSRGRKYVKNNFNPVHWGKVLFSLYISLVDK